MHWRLVYHNPPRQSSGTLVLGIRRETLQIALVQVTSGQKFNSQERGGTARETQILQQEPTPPNAPTNAAATAPARRRQPTPARGHGHR
jgi:hypothetical protein